MQAYEALYRKIIFEIPKQASGY